MKKTNNLIKLGVAGLIALGMTACGGGSSGGNTDYVPFEGDPHQLTAKVTFWHTMGQEIQDNLNRVIASFNKIYPNITIEHASQGGWSDIPGKIRDAIPAGTTPTMAYCYPDHVADYLSAGAVENLDGYIKDPIIGFGTETGEEAKTLGTDDYIDAFWKDGTSYGTEYGVENGVYSVPFIKSTEVMFYNKDFFDKNNLQVPTTWDEMETLMPKIKAINPEIVPLGYDSDANMFITMCEQYGIPYTSMDPENHFLFNNDQAKDLVRKLKGWFDNKYLITQNSSANNSYTSNFFTGQNTPQIVMTIGSTGGTGYNYTDNFGIGVAPIPGGTKNNHIISQGPSICFFSRATAEEKYAAWLFYKFISNTDNSAIFSTVTGYSPARKSSFDCKIFTDYRDDLTKTGKQKLIQTTLAENANLTDRYFVSPAFKGSATARNEMNGIIANVFLGTKSIDVAFDDALTNCLFTGE